MTYRLSEVRRWQARALRSGGRQLSVSTVEWHIAGRCEAPAFREIVGQQSHRLDDNRVKVRGAGVARLHLWTRCRICEACRRYRSNMWRDRAETELRQATRTWMCTFTMSPEWHHRSYMERMGVLRKKGLSPLEFDKVREFHERCHAFGKYLTDYFKRVRKNSGSQIRYLLVSESHKSGLPHFHALIHEAGSVPLSYRNVTDEWFAGFVHAKLVEGSDPRAVRYVTKYLSKQAVSRVRASLHYGKPRVPKPPTISYPSSGSGNEASRVDVKTASLLNKQKFPIF